jgi:hypothetical protein
MGATERTIITPQVSPDIRFYDAKTVGRELNRWVFFPGDVIVKRRKDEVNWLASGGDEINTPCLLRYGRGFLPRGFISPLEMGAEFIAKDALPPGITAQTGIEVDGVAIESHLVQIPVYPGDALINITMKSMNDMGRRRGLVEVESLKGKKWSECRSFNPSAEKGYLDLLDEAYFGDGREPTLRGLEAQIKAGSRLFPESEMDAERMLVACSEFRDWALNKIEAEHTRLRATPAPGTEAPTYSPLGELLLVQLEIERIDQPMASLANQNMILGQHLENAITNIAASQGGGFDMERFAQIMAQTIDTTARRVAAEMRGEQVSAVEENFDLTGERPSHVHHKTWEKMRRDAGLEE